MEKDYQVGKLIYDGDIYDGMNTEMTDLPFYSRWLSKKKKGNILDSVAAQAGSPSPLHRKDTVLPASTTAQPC